MPHLQRGIAKRTSTKTSLPATASKLKGISGGDGFSEMSRKDGKRKISSEKEKSYYPSFVHHFLWYLANVFARLCIECLFVYAQIRLYGFKVHEKYQCDQKPCPNLVDCFISRPMEKTIFLWFMLIYSCLCVMMNFLEFFYLLYTWAFKYSRMKRQEYKAARNAEKSNDSVWNANTKRSLPGSKLRTVMELDTSDDREIDTRDFDTEMSSGAFGSGPGRHHMVDFWGKNNKHKYKSSKYFGKTPHHLLAGYGRYGGSRMDPILFESDMEDDGHDGEMTFNDSDYDDQQDMDMMRDEIEDLEYENDMMDNEMDMAVDTAMDDTAADDLGGGDDY